jgi:hypothetical protein
MRKHLLSIVWLISAGSGLALKGCGDNPTTGTTAVAGQVVERHSRQPVGGGTVQVWLAGKGRGYGEAGDPQPATHRAGSRFASTPRAIQGI